MWRCVPQSLHLDAASTVQYDKAKHDIAGVGGCIFGCSTGVQ
jgi:hypothetical protein